MCEFGPDDATVAVWSCHFAPDDSDFAALSFSSGAVDECYFLSEVESAEKHDLLVNHISRSLVVVLLG